MKNNLAPTQLVELEGCLNFRDLGGYAGRDGRKVRTGRLYRSDALHHMTRRDVQRVRDELGVRSVVDLRSSAEIELDGVGPLAIDPVRYHHMPLFNEDSAAALEEAPMELGEQYFLMLRYADRTVARIIELLARTSEPALFHCAAGKDRTGVVAAVLLGLLGVSEEDIVRDYALTGHNLQGIVDRLKSSPSYQAIFRSLPPQTLHAEPGTMARLLKRLCAEYGSIREYALAGGLSKSTLVRLEERLLEAS